MKKDQAWLFEEAARVVRMCEGTNVEWWQCVKHLGMQCLRSPEFSHSPREYDFAVAIVEDKPVFVGDKLWFVDSMKHLTAFSTSCGYAVVMTDGTHFLQEDIDAGLLSWNPPKPKTLMVEVPISVVKEFAVIRRGVDEDSMLFLANCRKALQNC